MFIFENYHVWNISASRNYFFNIHSWKIDRFEVGNFISTLSIIALFCQLSFMEDDGHNHENLPSRFQQGLLFALLDENQGLERRFWIQVKRSFEYIWFSYDNSKFKYHCLPYLDLKLFPYGFQCKNIWHC